MGDWLRDRVFRWLKIEPITEALLEEILDSEGRLIRRLDAHSQRISDLEQKDMQTVTLTSGQANIDEKGLITSVDMVLTDDQDATLSLRFPVATAMQIRNLFREIVK